MRSIILLCAAGLSVLHAQTAVEAGLGASRAATTTAPAAGLGKSVAGVLSNLDKTLNKADKTSTVEVIHTNSSTAPDKVTPAKTYEDIKKAEVGLEYAQLVERFGPPSLEMAGTGSEKKLTYSGKDGATQIEVKDGKVSSVKKPQAQSAVFTLPK